MTKSGPLAQPLILRNDHTGERMEMVRRAEEDGEWLEVRATLPPHTAGPSLHLHRRELVEIRVTSGSLSVMKEGGRGVLNPGESVRFARGSDHRWWNETDDPVEFEMTVAPVVDFDRYLQGLFQIANAGEPGRPPLLYMAHLTLRHRHTQEVLVLPGMVHGPFWWSLRAIGALLGRYRGDDWPGAPARCPGAPVVVDPGATGERTA
jgi:quercetin dioxygenase-like cupin family protein